MANGQTRRTLRRKQNVAGNGAGTDATDQRTVASESGTVSTSKQHVDSTERNTVVASDASSGDSATIRNGVIEVDPNQLDAYIARDTSDGRDSSSGSDSDSGTRKRRTYTRRTRSKEAPPNIEAVATMLHTLAATVLHTPELILAPEETKQLSDAYANFCEYHDVPILTPKRMSEIQLISTAFMIYGTRLVAIRNRKRTEQNNARNVTEMPSRNVAHTM